jgi:hypothetical protein
VKTPPKLYEPGSLLREIPLLIPAQRDYLDANFEDLTNAELSLLLEGRCARCKRRLGYGYNAYTVAPIFDDDNLYRGHGEVDEFRAPVVVLQTKVGKAAVFIDEFATPPPTLPFWCSHDHDALHPTAAVLDVMRREFGKRRRRRKPAEGRSS